MDRISIVAALTLVACACFYDHAPKTSGETTEAASTGTTAAPTTGQATTGDAATGDASASGSGSGSASEGTTTGMGDPTTGVASDATTVAMDPSTTQPTPATTGDPSTGGSSEVCTGKPLLACYKCCAGVAPGSQVFFTSLAACACKESNQCLAACGDTLCKGLYPEDTCLACIGTMQDMTCVNQGNTACQGDTACGEFLACIADSSCL